MLSDPSKAALFLVEIAEQRYAGNRDFLCKSGRCQRRRPVSWRSLELPQPPLRADAHRTDRAGRTAHWAWSWPTRARTPVDFKLAFPHLEGLTGRGNPAADYYYFPWGGGIIADRPASIRRGYGDHERCTRSWTCSAPRAAAGSTCASTIAKAGTRDSRCASTVPGVGQEFHERMYVDTKPEFKWTHPLEPTPGTGLACEYLRRTRAAGGDFAPADALLARIRATGTWRCRPTPTGPTGSGSSAPTLPGCDRSPHDRRGLGPGSPVP